MTEYKNVKEALKDLYLFNGMPAETQDFYTGALRPAKASEIQELNLEVVYQLADLLGIKYDDLEAEEVNEGWD